MVNKANVARRRNAARSGSSTTAWPVEPAQAPDLGEKFAAAAGGRRHRRRRARVAVWRELLRAGEVSNGRRCAVDMLRSAGAFAVGRDLR